MRKLYKILASALVAGSILTYSLPVLADDGSATSAPQAQPAPGQTQPTPGQDNSPEAKAQRAKQKLQNEILHLQQADQFRQALGPIRDLQNQEKQLRSQIHDLRTTIHQQIQANRKAKNYPALVAALSDMIPMQDDIAAAENAAKTCKDDWAQLKADNQAKNTSAVAADLQKIQSDMQNRIQIYQKILADLQKISQDLGTQPQAPATSNNNTANPSAPATNQ